MRTALEMYQLIESPKRKEENWEASNNDEQREDWSAHESHMLQSVAALPARPTYRRSAAAASGNQKASGSDEKQERTVHDDARPTAATAC